MKTHRGRSPDPNRDAVRTATVTIRLDPRLRYLTDLAARSRRETVSRFIEGTMRQALSTEVGSDPERLWHPDPLVRFLRLACMKSALLTFGEQVLWKRITENPQYWEGAPSSINVDLLRKDWDVLREGVATL